MRRPRSVADLPSPGLLLGLTGGVATGKSSVANILHEFGATIIDADQVSRDLMGPGSPLVQQLASAFGQDLVGSEGVLNRSLLASRTFGNEQAVARLNSIALPPIWEELGRRVGQARARGEVVVLMAPLLIENGHQHDVDQVWLVTSHQAQQVERQQSRNGASEHEARARMGAQLSTEEKLPFATVVIDNSGPLDQTRAQVKSAWERWVAR